MTRQYGRKLVKISLYVTPEIQAQLSQMQPGQASEFVRQAVNEKLAREDAAAGSYAEYKYQYPDREVVK